MESLHNSNQMRGLKRLSLLVLILVIAVVSGSGWGSTRHGETRADGTGSTLFALGEGREPWHSTIGLGWADYHTIVANPRHVLLIGYWWR